MQNVDLHHLLGTRIEYLKSLHLISHDWISGVPGGSQAPTLDTCNSAIAYLIHLRGHPCLDDSLKLVLGPMPRGGVSTELSNGVGSLSVEFHNNGCVEIMSDNGKGISEESISTSAEVSLKLEQITETFLIREIQNTNTKPRT